MKAGKTIEKSASNRRFADRRLSEQARRPRDFFYPESRFGGFTDVDGTIAFYSRVNELLDTSSVVLDVGCGRGKDTEDPVAIRRTLRILKGKVARVIGIDVDDAGRQNPSLDEFRRIEGAQWPVEDGSVDLCLCDSVIEHLEEPEHFFAEVCRVLGDRGYLCVRTPNSWSYVALLSRVIPNRMHARVLQKVQVGRDCQDVFPTYYRCNSIPRLRSALAKYGFDAVVYGYGAEPSYLFFSRIAYWLGVLHQRFAPRIVQPAIFAFARLEKPPAAEGVLEL